MYELSLWNCSAKWRRWMKISLNILCWWGRASVLRQPKTRTRGKRYWWRRNRLSGCSSSASYGQTARLWPPGCHSPRFGCQRKDRFRYQWRPGRDSYFPFEGQIGRWENSIEDWQIPTPLEFRRTEITSCESSYLEPASCTSQDTRFQNAKVTKCPRCIFSRYE